MLDRPGGFSRVNLLAPLRHRDFRLLWAGMTISLVGDGIFLVAMAWQAYELWNAPAALSARRNRDDDPDDRLPSSGRDPQRSARPPHADAVRGPARALVIGALAVLSVTGHLTFWELVVVVALYGIGTAFFTPAFEAIVPDIVPGVRSPGGQLTRPVRPADCSPSRRPCSGRRARRRTRLGRRVRASMPLPSSHRPSPSS